MDGKEKESEFEEFRKYIFYWLRRFGLIDWEISYIKNMPIENGCPFARVEYNLNQKVAWFYFYGDLANKQNIKQKALHEVLHLLLAEAKTNCLVEHTIINRLLEVINE